jgi:Flp pilus assembly secretin CpaC
MRTVLVAAVACAVITSASAQERMYLSGSDATASFMTLDLNKSIVIDLPKDLAEVVVADAKTVSAVVHSKRRVYVIGAALGQTNVYFFDNSGQQIGALDVVVVGGSPRPAVEINPTGAPAQVIVVYRGGAGATYSCTPQTCVGASKADTTQYSQITHISK